MMDTNCGRNSMFMYLDDWSHFSLGRGKLYWMKMRLSQVNIVTIDVVLGAIVQTKSLTS